MRIDKAGPKPNKGSSGGFIKAILKPSGSKKRRISRNCYRIM